MVISVPQVTPESTGQHPAIMGVLAPLTLTLRSSIRGLIGRTLVPSGAGRRAERPPLLLLAMEEGPSSSYPLAGSRAPAGPLRTWLPSPGPVCPCTPSLCWYQPHCP